MESNVRDKVVFASPKDFDERALVAGTCVRRLGIKFPAVIDGFENTAEKAYTGWPDRIYLIDSKGRVAYKSRPGPFGFKPEELKAALVRLPSEQSRDQRTPIAGTVFHPKSLPLFRQPEYFQTRDAAD
jgi:hypothetical protein